MSWAAPKYSKARVDKAGRALSTGFKNLSIEEFIESYEVINNWRSSHSFPLNTFQTTLRNKSRTVDSESLVAQRIKRLSSIQAKLKRFSGIRLSQMQDIGGCRSIVNSVEDVRKLVSNYRRSDLKHQLLRVDDYMEKPQKSGYRGVHLIYNYSSDKSETYNSLKIEMQLRSGLQHSWATAVETAGTFIRQALKSSQSEEQWLRFFSLMGSVVAYQEGTPFVDGTPDDYQALVAEIREINQKFAINERLLRYGDALQILETTTGKSARYFLLQLDPSTDEIKVTGYRLNELRKAQDDYLAAERALSEVDGDAVLVSVDSVANLRKAYPNYFLDTRVFAAMVDGILYD